MNNSKIIIKTLQLSALCLVTKQICNKLKTQEYKLEETDTISHNEPSIEAINEVLIDACFYGHLDIVEDLIEDNADIHTDNEKPLMEACKNGRYEVVEYLVENGADIHTDNEKPLMEACRNGRYEIVEYLVENGADIHANNDMALVVACDNLYFDIAKYLISKGINPSTNNYHYVNTAPKKYLLELFLKQMQRFL